MQGQIEIQFKGGFSAVHQLQVDGVEEKPHIHNWVVTVIFSMPPPGDPALKRTLEKRVKEELAGLEGRDLGSSESLQDRPPSAENLAFAIFNLLRQKTDKRSARITRVTVEETPRCRASYLPD